MTMDEYSDFLRRSIEAQENPKPPIALRDWFAGQAIQAVIRQCAGDLQVMANNNWEGSIEEYFAKKAYGIADAMLAARTEGGDDD